MTHTSVESEDDYSYEWEVMEPLEDLDIVKILEETQTKTNNNNKNNKNIPNIFTDHPNISFKNRIQNTIQLYFTNNSQKSPINYSKLLHFLILQANQLPSESEKISAIEDIFEVENFIIYIFIINKMKEQRGFELSDETVGDDFRNLIQNDDNGKIQIFDRYFGLSDVQRLTFETSYPGTFDESELEFIRRNILAGNI